MARIFTPVRLLMAGLVLLGVAAVLFLVPSDKYILLPVEARAVAPYVTVQGEHDDHDGGGIYYVAVEIDKASILEKLAPWLHEGSTLVPASAVRLPGESESEHERQEQRAMAQSQEIGAAVALEALGQHVVVHGAGTLIVRVLRNGPSAGKLKPNDIVSRVDGQALVAPTDFRRLLRKHRPGQSIELTVLRSGRERSVSVKAGTDPDHPTRPFLGVFTPPPNCSSQPPAKIDLPISVHIDLGRVGGPSAGLAFALDVVEELGRDVDRGHKVAATGELCVDGTVVPVGGLKQKTIGAKRAGADVFLVPAGDNAAVARRYAGSMRVLPVESFRQALHELATLRKK